MASNTPHLDALRRHLGGAGRRLFQVLVVFGLGMALTWWYHAAIARWLMAPAQGRLSPTGLPIVTGITDAFNFTVHLSLMGGMIAAAPVASFHILRLISPALSRKLRWFIILVLLAATASFLSGAAFAYFFVLPLVITYMLGFSAGMAVPMITLDEYMREVKVVIIGIGVVFETPLVMFLLAKLRLVSRDRVKFLRRFVPGVAFLFAGFISNTFELTIPIAMIALFEVGLGLMWFVERGRKPRKPKAKKVRP